MKKMWKRFVSLLLACTLLAGMLPLSASAAGKNRTEDEWTRSKYGQKLIEAGYNFAYGYELADTDIIYASFSIFDIADQEVSFAYVFAVKEGGALTSISDFQSGGAPWSNMLLGQVYIEDEVTGIGSNAFGSMPTLETVVFEDASKLTYIGQRAFYDDDNAVFTDEGNEGENATLDLSGVTTMGEYAFYNCDKLTGVELGDMTAVETVEGKTEKIENKIPNHAFTSTGVQSITVPSGITEVGEYAFYDCPLNKDPHISLQEGLATIGDYAFGKNDAAPNTMMTSLTIPSSVQSIGDHAFYNYTELQTVTVLGKDNGGAKESALKHVGDAAFGDADHNAYSTTTTIQDAVNPEIEYTGLVGTQFYLPKELEKNDKLFVNGETCYTGDITPMQYVDTEPADCINAGYDIYKTTFTGAASGGEPIVMTYHYPIPALGHDYGPITEVKRTCENDNYFVQFCERKNCPNEGDAVGSLWKSGIGMGLFDPNTDQKLTEEELRKWREKFQDHQGHEWEAKSVVNPTIEAGKTTTLYYSCANPDHGETDRYSNPFSIDLTGKTINALTTQSPDDIANQLVGFTNYGKVELVSSSDKPFGTEGTTYLEVKYTMTQDKNQNWPVFTKALEGTPDSASGTATLKIKVNVTKDVLDLSNVSILPNMVNVGTPAAVKADGFGAATPGEVEYFADGEWTTTQPDKEGEEYKVRVKFTYDAAMYDLPEEGDLEYPGEGYTLKREGDSVWVEHSFVVALHQITAQAREISGLIYDGTAKKTLEVIGLEDGWHVSVTATKQGSSESAATWEYIGTENEENIISGLSLTDAGTYNVQVVFTYPDNPTYEKKTQNLEVHIDHKQVAKPVALQNMKYEPVSEERSGFTQETSDVWEFVDEGDYTHVGINARKYTAKAKLTNENYRWENTDEAVRDITIPWEILKRELYAPSISVNLYNYQYDKWVNPLVNPNSDYSFEVDKGTNTVKLVYIGNQDAEDYDSNAAVAYTAANAYHTNRGKYSVTVTLNASGNYVWYGSAPSDLTWSINPATLSIPKITAQNATYTGEPYAAETWVSVAAAELPDDVKSKGYQYSNDASFRSPSSTAPTNAGTYYVRQNYTYNNQNYIAQIPYASFTINKATAKMTFENPTETKTYTAQGTDLQQVTVDGLVEADTEKMETVLGDVKYTYKYSTEPNPNWESMEAQQITEPAGYTFTTVGYYQITATWGTGTVSNNYTAAPAIYTLTIEKADDQEITLTSAGTNEGKWDGENNSYTTTYGSENTFTVTGEAALDNADISYEVNGDSEVVSVNGSSGEVTIKQAGEATITVTAADTDNVTGTSVDYTVTVEKATPTLGLNAGTAAYTGSEVAEDTYKKATLSGAGEGYAQPDKEKLEYYFYTYDEDGKETILADKENENALKTIPSSVGDYWLKVVFPGDACYSDAAAVAKFTITPAELSVLATGHTGTYDGTEYPAIKVNSVTGNDTQLAEGNYTVKYAKTTEEEAPAATAENVWKDTLSVKDVADSSSGSLYYWYMVQDTAGNYEPKIEQVNVSITPAALKLNNVPDSYSKTYDGDNDVETDLNDITVTGIATEPISVTATGTYADKNAGEGKNVTLNLTLSGTDTWGNYSYNGTALTEGEITLTKDDAGTINPKEITVTGISAVNRVYDGTTKVQLTGTPATTEGSFIVEDDVSFSAISNQTGTVTDAKAEDGKTVTVAAETLKGLLTGEDAENYTVTQEYPTTVDITPRPVTLQFPNGNSSMTTSYDPNGLTSKPNVYKVSAVAPAEGTGFVSSDALADGDIQYTFKQDAKDVENPINVGEYTVTAELTDEAAKKWSNYTIEAITGTVEIIQATEELTVTVTEKTGLTYTGQGQDPIQSISVKGGNVTLSEDDGDYEVQFKLSEEGDYELDRDQLTAAVKDAKEYTVYWQVTTTNYGNKTDSFTVKVAPATLTLSSDLTKEKEYDGTTAAVVTEQKVMGAQSGENITVSSVSAAYDNANVGTGKTITITYTVTFDDGVTPGNYTIGNNGAQITQNDDGTWTVTTEDTGSISAKSITVTIADKNKIYDGKTPSVTSDKGTDWTVDEGALCSQDGTVDELWVVLSVESDGNSAVGTYAITGTANNSNYAVTFAGSWKGEEHNGTAGTYTIDPRPIDVKIGDAEGFYGDAPVLKGVELTYESTGDNRGLAPDEENVPGIELGTGANKESPVAEYTIYAVNGDNQVGLNTPVVIGNYKVTFTQNGTYTVKPRPITITIKDHSSKYGAEIDGGIADPVSDKDYTVAITGNATTGDAIVNNDALTVTLETTASAKAAAGTYDITGSAEGEKVNNYAITWAGNGGDRDSGGKNGKYTIEEAGLAISFEKGNQVLNGVSINITDSYNANPLALKNASTNDVVSKADKETLGITYSIAEAGENGGSTNVATIDEKTGEVTIHSTGTVRITAKVTANEGSNYTGTQTTWYELNIISGGQMTVNVTPKTNLAYTGDPQALLESASCSLDSAEIQYSLDNRDWGDEIPKGTNAGTYTVYVKATDPNSQYSDVTEHVTVTIAKANLEGRFTHDPYPHVLATDGNNYDSAVKNPLTITSQNYNAKPANYTYYSDNMRVASSANGTSTIVITGTAGESATIHVTVPGDNNYNEGTFTYTLEISDDLSKIKYNVTGITTTYNGQPQTIEVNVTAPASGATVRYWNESTNAYTLSEPPAYTDVQADGYPIKFQITAPGYEKEEDTATLKIEPKDIRLCQVEGIAESYTYVGHQIIPETVAVVDDSVILTKGKDYTIDYGENTEIGEDEGFVTITGKGNYKGSVTKNFTISPVDASDLTASLDRTFGYYDDSETNNATVTVTHGRHTVDSSEIELTVTRQDSTIESGDVVQEGLKLTFNKAGIYTIHVEVSGTHTGTFDLTYTLLPQDVASDDFQVATDPVDRVWTYDGENHAFGVTVTSGGTSLQKDVDFTLHYTYLPYVGNPTDDVYDPGTTVFTEAGIYTVIVEGTGNYTGHAELVALIQPRDLSDAGITAAFAQTGLVYNGEAQKPDVTLTYNGTAISQLKDTEYYGNTNAGEAQALSAASEDCNNFTGARVDAFTIEKKSLNDSTITAKADPEKYYYTGYPVTPAVTVTDSGRNVGLSIGADYTVTSNAVGPGKVTATVTGTGNYTDTVTVEFTILPTGAEPVETLDLTVTPSEWTWDNGQTKAAISVTFNGTELNDTDYQLTVSKDGETPQTVTKEQAVELLSAPGKYTITATGMDAYAGSTDTETVTIKKIQPTVTVTATPNSLSGGGKVTLTLKGEKLPNGTDLKTLLSVTAKNDNDVTLEDLHIQWPEDGSLTAELTLPNTNETYTFALRFVGNDYYESASSNAMVVVGQQTSGGGGGSDPGDQPADPDDTGVSDWLNTKDHLAYLAGYPGGTFGPDQNMTRAEAAQMFYNLLLEKDVEITVEFEDVPADAWYAKPVNTLASLGILSGVGNGRFDPERSITRAEFTVIAMKFANTSGGGVNIFSDVNEDDWFYSAVVDSTQYGWINGYPDGTFRPEATISRAEVTVIVNHMLGRAADRPYVIAHEEELNTFGDVNRGHWGYFHVAEATNAHEYHTEDGTESWTGLS